MNDLIKRVQNSFAQDMTKSGLKAAIIVVAIILIILALNIENEWVLAGILAYELLP